MKLQIITLKNNTNHIYFVIWGPRGPNQKSTQLRTGRPGFEGRLAKHSHVQQVKKKKRNTPIYFNANYRAETKLVPVIMDNCLLQFDASEFFLGVRLHWGSLSNFNFFNVNPQIFQRNRKVLVSNFHEIPNNNLRDIRRRNYS